MMFGVPTALALAYSSGGFGLHSEAHRALLYFLHNILTYSVLALSTLSNFMTLRYGTRLKEDQIVPEDYGRPLMVARHWPRSLA